MGNIPAGSELVIDSRSPFLKEVEYMVCDCCGKRKHVDHMVTDSVICKLCKEQEVIQEQLDQWIADEYGNTPPHHIYELVKRGFEAGWHCKETA